jgi:hypothetical protein
METSGVKASKFATLAELRGREELLRQGFDIAVKKPGAKASTGHLRTLTRALGLCGSVVFKASDLASFLRRLGKNPSLKPSELSKLAAGVVSSLFTKLPNSRVLAGALRRSGLSESVRLHIRDRVGHLALFSPLSPDGTHILDLSKQDEAQVARMMMMLGLVEGANANWLNASLDGHPVDIPASWLWNLPRRGVLRVTYETTEGTKDSGMRNRLDNALLRQNSTISLKRNQHNEAHMLRVAAAGGGGRADRLSVMAWM